MELIDYLRWLWRYRWWLLIGLVVGGAAGGTYAALQKQVYQATMSLYVQRQADPPNSQYFTYEGYYAQQTATNYTDTALKLLTNDEIVKRAAESAGLATDNAALARWRGSVVSKKDAPQLIKVTVTLGDQGAVTRFTEGLAEALKSRTTELNQDGDRKLAVDPVNTAPYVVPAKPLVWLYALAGVVLGLIVAVVISAFAAYSRKR